MELGKVKAPGWGLKKTYNNFISFDQIQKINIKS
jgi:hypothetical protein